MEQEITLKLSYITPAEIMRLTHGIFMAKRVMGLAPEEWDKLGRAWIEAGKEGIRKTPPENFSLITVTPMEITVTVRNYHRLLIAALEVEERSLIKQLQEAKLAFILDTIGQN